MSEIVFVDTGAWFASVVPTDPNHQRIKRWFELNDFILLTTDYVIDETLTLLRARGERTRSLEIGKGFHSNEIAEIYRLSEEDFNDTWDVFRTFDDKNWSFTDCSSKIVIDKLGIGSALSFDHHFNQFGSVIVLPE